MTPTRVIRAMSQFLCTVLLLLTSGALLAQNKEHRVRNCSASTALGRMVLAEGRLRLLVKDGYNISIVQQRKPPLKTTSPPPSSLLCKMDHAFLSLIAMGVP